MRKPDGRDALGSRSVLLSGDPSQACDAKQTDPLSRRSETQPQVTLRRCQCSAANSATRRSTFATIRSRAAG